MLSSYFTTLLAPDPLLWSQHNPWLVALSVFVAMGASAVALHLATLARDAEHAGVRQTALASGALVLGSGTWTMHYVGIQAFTVCGQAGFSPWMTLVSVLPALAAAWVALHLLAREKVGWGRLAAGSVLVAAGIGAMHYIGMAASRLAPSMRYDVTGFVLSFAVAVLLAALALWVRFGLQRHWRGRVGWVTAGAGAVMGLAIAGMHYTGMAALRFVEPIHSLRVTASMVPVQTTLSLAVAVVAVALGLVVVAVNAYLRNRQLLDAVQASEAYQRTLLDTAADAVVIVDDQGLVRSFNAGAEAMFGWSAEQISGQPFTRLVPEALRADRLRLLQQFLASGAQRQDNGADGSGLAHDGRIFPTRLTLGRLAQRGAPWCVGFITDMSARNAMEDALRRNEEQLRALVGNMPGIVFRCRNQEPWPMAFISGMAQQITGWSADDFVQRRVHFGQLIQPEDRARIAADVDYALQRGQSYHVEYRITTHEGKTRWISEYARGVPGESGLAHWIDGVLLDITDAKARNAEFVGTIAAIDRSQAVAEFNLQGHLLRANANFLALMGYTLDEVIGRPHAFFCTPEDVASAAYADFWQRLAAGEVQAGEHQRVGKDGRAVWLLATYNPIFDVQGQAFKIVELASDLSARRAMEQDLRRAKEQAEQAAAARASFLANMSHEIRTPMNAILGFSDALLDSPLDATQRRQLTLVQRSGQTLLSLLNDILDTAKLDKGAMVLEQRDFSLRELCQQMMDSMRITAVKKGLELALDYPDAVPAFFCGDALRLQQVLVNLLSNAIKFTECGQVLLRVAYADAQLRLEVHDSGIGMTEEQLARVFDPFAQADSSTTRRFGGTGLGTTIARQLVELMQGSISVSSQFGVGSQFCVRLPLPMGQAPQAAARRAVVELPPLSILAVDDIAPNLELLQVTLARSQHRLVLAGGGEEALARCAAERFDLVLMDLQMPGIDGLEATRRIRAQELRAGQPAVPIIALSASVLAEDQRAAVAAGMNGFAHKPLDLPRLCTEIARVLGLQAQPTLSAAPRDAQADPRPDPLEPIDWPRGQHLWGDGMRLHAVITRWLQEHAALPDELQRLVAAADWHALASLAHRARGTAGNLALGPLHALLARLESAALAQNASACADALQPLPAVWQAVAQALAAHPLSAGSASGGPAGAARAPLDEAARAQLQAALEQARQSLARGELPEAALAALGALLPPEALVPLLEALDQFAFERALERLDALHEQTQDVAA